MTHGSLEEWTRWQRRRQGLPRRLRRTFNGRKPSRLQLYAASEQIQDPPIVVALDFFSPSQIATLMRPTRILMERGTTPLILAPETLHHHLSDIGYTPTIAGTPQSGSTFEMVRPSVVLSIGHYMPAGMAGYELARQHGAPYLVIQHGVVTPYSPPLADGAHLMAWSQADGQFWSNGSENITVSVVGSQTLWDASRERVDVDPQAPLCFLGQLHGAELTRSVTRRTMSALLATGDVTYRPHPGETDIKSRLQHRAWRRQGAAFSASDIPLTKLGTRIAAIFSTGILEAAAAGLPAYGVCERPPAWIREFWERYEIQSFDSGRETEVQVGQVEPSQLVADAVGAI